MLETPAAKAKGVGERGRCVGAGISSNRFATARFREAAVEEGGGGLFSLANGVGGQWWARGDGVEEQHEEEEERRVEWEGAGRGVER